ncbi:MAG: PTS sugar transporter subunit IIB [Erysipelotrichaceae bacterium]|nr:PTS sugar transporter subunit IIB [Erysipelotrichaceae bacterium]
MDEFKQPSGILDVRVDDRMVHGIVATSWIPAAKATRAMVVNKRASESDMTRNALKLGTPAGVNLSVLAPEKAIANILNGNYTNQRVFLVGRYIKDIYDLYKGGVKFARVNLGNVTQNVGKTTSLDKTVRVSDEELVMLREMRDAGIKITCQFRTDDQMKEPSLD